MRVLAVDIGSTAIKAGVFDTAARQQKSFARVGVESHLAGVQVEVPANRLLCAMEDAMRTALAQAGSAVDILALDVFSPGVVVLDRKGRVAAGCITHQDRRSITEAWEIEKIVGQKRHLQIAGNRPFAGGIGSTTLRWLKHHRPEILRPGCLVGQASSLILRHLTGQFVIDPSQAAFLGLWDIRRGRGGDVGNWNDELCHAAGVHPAALPRLAWADQILGQLTPAAARRLGLPSGLPVTGGLVDTSAAVVATGMLPGQLVHNAGSTDVLALCTQKPQPAPDILTRPVGTGANLPARWLAVSTTAASGAAIHWLRQVMFSEMPYDQFESLLRQASRAHASRTPDTATVLFEPYLAGDRTSMEQLKGALKGLTLATTRADILHSVVAALVQTNAARLARLRQLETVLPRVYTMGGRSDLGTAMHRTWPPPAKHKTWQFTPIPNEALTGLVKLAQAATA